MKKLLFIALVILASCGKKDAVCGEHFSGENCDIETPPQYVVVKEVRVTTFLVPQPKLILCHVIDGAIPNYNKESNIVGASLWMDCRNFNCGAYSTLKVEFYDGDTGRLIGKVSGQAYQANKLFPVILTLKSAELQCELRVGYTW